MPQPTAQQLYIDVPLTEMMVSWIQDESHFISQQIFPVVPVNQQSGLFWKFDKGDWSRVAAKPRADGAESAGSGFTLSTGNYYCEVEAVHKDVTDRQRANTVAPIDVDQLAARFVSSQLALRREQKWANAWFVTGVWTGSSGGGDITGVAGAPGANQVKQWDQAGSTPVEDVMTQLIFVAGATGFRPNTLLIGPSVWKALVNNAEFLARVQYGGTPGNPATLTETALAAIFGVDRVLVAWGVVNNAQEGATNSLAYLFGKHALLAYAAPAPSLTEPSAGYTIAWSGYLGSNAIGGAISSFRMPQLRADRIEGELSFQLNQVAPELGVFWSGVVS